MDKDNKKRPKPLVLIILDGWGVSQPFTGNAISQARTITMDNLISEYPTMTLRASGDAVGLPWGESGNSEVGHLNLGLGRVVYQDLPKINKCILDGSFNSNKVLLSAVEHVKKNNSKLHFMGLSSDGSVHASIEHLYALIAFAKIKGLEKVYIHAFLDGRDTPLDSARGFIRKMEEFCKDIGVGEIATMSGRFYAMDRNNNWDRTALAYDAMVKGKGQYSDNAQEALEQSYKKKIYDEEFIPTVITRDSRPLAKVEDGDALIFFDYRPDRARQMTKAFILDEMSKFDRGEKLNDLYFAGFTEYEKGLVHPVVFPKEVADGSLGEAIAKAGLKQLRIAETEKYAHVTYFFNGGRETKSEGEDHELIPSKAVSSYDQAPEMSSNEVTTKVVEYISDDKYDFILINFANADMVGHTGNMEAAIKAVEALDVCVDKVVNSVLAKNGVVMITADHGNAEAMFNMQSGQIDKEHTANPVPFLLIGKEYAGRKIGWLDTVSDDLSTAQPQGILADVAPTVIELLGIERPEEMTGISLLSTT